MKSFEQVMTYLSRATIIIPVVVLLVAIGFYFNDAVSPVKVLNTLNEKQISPTPTVAPQKEDKIAFNLQGPLNCEYETSTATFSASIKNKQIKINSSHVKKESHMLLKGDCVYVWEGKKGKKICGVGQYVSMFEMFSGFGVMNLDTVLGMLPQLGVSSQSLPKEADMEKIMKSCKKSEVADEIFILPKDVVYSAEPLMSTGSQLKP